MFYSSFFELSHSEKNRNEKESHFDKVPRGGAGCPSGAPPGKCPTPASLPKLGQPLPFSPRKDSCRRGLRRNLGWEQMVGVGPTSPCLPCLLSVGRKW